MALVVVLIVYTLAKLSTASVDHPVSRVVHGRTPQDNEYTYVVSLEVTHRRPSGIYRTCTGSLVTDQWVLTAANCYSATVVRYGNMTLPRNESKSFSKILKKIHHPNWKLQARNHVLMVNDIAMMLVESITLKSYARISASDYTTFLGKHVVFAGYGLASNILTDLAIPANFSDIIRELERVPLQISEGVALKCEKYADIFIYPTICVSPKCDMIWQQTTPGDRGGPLFFANDIIAVLSANIPFNLFDMGNHQGAWYVPVSPYFSWIHNVMNSG